MSGPGSSQSPERLQKLRAELRQWGQQKVPQHIADRVDLSGVIQQTFLDAYRTDREFLLRDEAVLKPWLTKIFDDNLVDELRRVHARRRDLRREPQLSTLADDSSDRLLVQLAADGTSPGQRLRAEERRRLLFQVMDELTDDQRHAIELHFLQHVPLAEVAVVMDRSVAAVGSLVARGMKQLRARLQRAE